MQKTFCDNCDKEIKDLNAEGTHDFARSTIEFDAPRIDVYIAARFHTSCGPARAAELCRKCFTEIVDSVVEDAAKSDWAPDPRIIPF